MRKRLAAIIMTVAVALGLSFTCLGFAACGGGSADAGDKGTLVVDTKRDVGEYSGYEVWYARYYYAGTSVNDVLVDREIDGVFISTAPDPSYNYVVDLGDGEYILLSEAYEQGLITHEDLEAIAAAEAASGAYKQDRVAYLEIIRTVEGEYSGYEVCFADIDLTDKVYHSGAAEITIDGVYICTVQVDMYDYIIFPDGEDEDPILLSEAYEQGYITREDLEAIAEAEAEYLAANEDESRQWVSSAE